MIEAFKVEPTCKKQQEISKFLTGYWKNDVWRVDNPFFDELRIQKWSKTAKSLDFSPLPLLQRDELKFMVASRLQNQEIQLSTVFGYDPAIKRLGGFLNIYYPGALSIVDLPYDKAGIQWRTFLIEGEVSFNCTYVDSVYQVIFNQLYTFFVDFYDSREETEKDIWDVRKIPGTRITENKSCYLLNFVKIPMPFRSLAKRYLKFRITIVSHSQGSRDLFSLRLFFRFLYDRYSTWHDLINLDRKDMESYLSWYKGYSENWKEQKFKCLIAIKTFLEYIQRAQYPEAPELPSLLLLFKEDLPRRPQITGNDIKYIPDGVLQQLEDHLENLSPVEYIPVVLLLRACGWRISDILNLKSDKCLDRTGQGWYLCGDIVKTQVLNHRVPITDQLAHVVQAVVEEVKQKSTFDNNPNKLLFVRFSGRRKGHCLKGDSIRNALNRLAKQQNIVDDQGNIFHFGNHAFRHYGERYKMVSDDSKPAKPASGSLIHSPFYH